MADNVDVAAGSYTATVAGDEIGGAVYQRVKLTFGVDGTATDVSAAAGAQLPVALHDPHGCGVAQVLRQLPALTDCGLAVRLVGTLAEDAAHSSGDPGVMLLAVRVDSATALATTDGDYIPLQTDANGFLRITLATELSDQIDSIAASGSEAHDATATKAPVRVAGTASLVPRAAVATGDVDQLWTDGCGRAYVIAQGGVAHDAALTDLVQPVLSGAAATTALSGATLVASGDLTRLAAGVDGVQITRPHAGLEDIVTGNITVTDGSCSTLIAHQAGLKLYLTSLTLTNTCSTSVYVELKNAGTAVHTVPVPGFTGGATLHFPVPLPGSVNGGWGADPSAAATSVIISAVGFRSKV